MDFKARLEALRKKIEEARLSAYLVNKPTSICYFSGFLESSAPAILILTERECALHVTKISEECTKGAEHEVRVANDEKTLMRNVANELRNIKGAIGFDEIRASTYLKLTRVAVKLKHEPSLVWALRSVKEEEELACLKEAVRMAEAGMEAGMEAVRPNVRENEVAAEAEYAMRAHGAESFAFDTIVASGPRAAIPHAGCGTRKLREGDFVIIDVGATYKGYRSDLSRTCVVGRPSEKQRRIYEAVLKAQEAVFNSLKDGVAARAVDRAARSMISAEGYEDRFVHGTGHGIGLDVHEPPSLSSTSEESLSKDNVVTNEPAVYLSGFGGVRVEDMIHVLEDGAERLSRFPKDLL